MTTTASPATNARVTWIEKFRFEADASSHHSLVVDGDKVLASSPMELVLMRYAGARDMTLSPFTRRNERRSPVWKCTPRGNAPKSRLRSTRRST